MRRRRDGGFAFALRSGYELKREYFIDEKFIDRDNMIIDFKRFL